MQAKSFLLILILLASVITFTGCASKGVNMVKTGDVSVQIKNTNRVEINNVYVKQLKNEVLIHADVRPVKPTRFFQPGHLSFVLLTANGQQIFDLDVARYTREHMGSHNSAMKHVSFWVRMPLIIPKGAKLKVAHHNSTDHNKPTK